jgi:hypothetical protein
VALIWSPVGSAEFAYVHGRGVARYDRTSDVVGDGLRLKVLLPHRQVSDKGHSSVHGVARYIRNAGPVADARRC